MAKDEKPKDKTKVRAALARAESLTANERRVIATKAAAARWGRTFKATHKGSFKEDFGIDVDCFVLDDPQKTAVISQRGMSAALAMGSGLPRFLEGQKIAPYVDVELAKKLANPLVFQWSPSMSNTPPAVVYGYEVTILIDVCKTIIAADSDGKLLSRQSNIVKQAHIILNASAKAGIQGLVYALAGYDVTRAEVIQAFKQYVREEAREYEKEFPDKLYDEWYRLYGMPRPKVGRSWKLKHLTVEQVYTPLARSNGKILDLARAQKAVSEDRYALHQFLSEIGVKALRTHLGRLLGMAEVASSRAEYEKFFEKVFSQQLTLDV
jgi:hypothetical protein